MANRLATATSPYLLQHADNPVDWHEWGPEAFTEASERDVPVFLSIGYAACHWCHVMAHESFEDPTTAAYLNEHFVPVKVDREERPDVDAIYMEATQAMTGQGGWPMSCMLTPDGAPFFAGTYYPGTAAHGMPSFQQVMEAVTQAWQERRGEVADIGTKIAHHLQEVRRLPDAQAADVGGDAVSALRSEFDADRGGFGGAPKFPPSMVCEFLLRRAARTGHASAQQDADPQQMAEQTLEAMARGGIFDQLGGGFARYSVDAHWQVPHFEKMLSDNALLLRAYLHWWRQTGAPLAERVARASADFVLRELTTPEGGFASSLDADSDGVEGAYYVWTPDQLTEALGSDDAAFAAETFGVTEAGNFERGASTLRLVSDPADQERFADVVRRLHDVRRQRTRPARDDKVVAAWNGLMIGALAEAGVLLHNEEYLDAARRAATLIVEVHLHDGHLRRASRDGTAGEPAGVLEDYADVAHGMLVLFGVTGESRWYDAASTLIEQIRTRFAAGDGGFYDTASDAEVLFKRPQDPTDNATPSGQSMVLSTLVSMHGLTGDSGFRDEAEQLWQRLAAVGEKAPRFAGESLAVAEALADGPRQIAVVGSADDPGRAALLRAALATSYPGAVFALGDGDSSPVPLLEDRKLIDGRSAAYVCRGFVCDRPVTDPGELAVGG